MVPGLVEGAGVVVLLELRRAAREEETASAAGDGLAAHARVVALHGVVVGEHWHRVRSEGGLQAGEKLLSVHEVTLD